MLGQRSTTGLLGREREQAELYDALSLALEGYPQVVVMGGDAGMGKSTLVADLVRRADELGATAVMGHCLDIDAGIAFGAVLEAVGELVADVEDLEARPHARRMQALLDPERPRGPEAFRVREDLLQTVLEATRAGPVLLGLEDMHWAGRSTLDFAVALSRTARGRLLVVLTVRKDDLHRRHPARKALAEISAAPAARHVDLEPLDRDAIAGIVAARTGARPDASVVTSVVDRSEGNPLYAQELLAVDPRAVPDRLSDLFLARVDALADGPRGLARTASVDGTRVDAETLSQVAGLDQATLDVHLRDLLDANVLRTVDDSLEFWHGLLREALYDDLLPDERTRLHAAHAGLLQRLADLDPDPRLSLLSRLAFHAAAAHESSRALVASERAGMAALKVGAAESVTHLERAISLWDDVPDAEPLVGRTKIELVISLARAALDQGDGERWHSLNRKSVDMIEPDTAPLVACRAYASFAYSALNIDDTIDAPAAIGLALEHAGEEPSEERAYALGTQALWHILNCRWEAALEAADLAAEAARAVGATDALSLDLEFASEALMALGRVVDSCAVLEQAIAIDRDAGMLRLALGDEFQLANRLLDSGNIERAISVARAGHQEGLAEGLPLAAAYCGLPLVTALTYAGRLEEAETLLEDLWDLGLPSEFWWVRADLVLARGDVEALNAVLPEDAMDPAPTGPPPDEFRSLRQFQVALLRDDQGSCLDVAEHYMTRVENSDSPLEVACAARMGFEVLTLMRHVAEAQTVVVRNRAVRLLERARKGSTDEWRRTYWGVQLALAEGYAARLTGQPGAGHFREAARLAGPFGDYFALEPRLELAQELLAHGGRDEGRELLVDCWTAAHGMGAAGLSRRAARLATKVRVALPESGSSEGALSRLTPREREVLDLLATGATNKGIAEALVISDKTVSVHVSNVLAKLGVENRGAAAALARGMQA